MYIHQLALDLESLLFHPPPPPFPPSPIASLIRENSEGAVRDCVLCSGDPPVCTLTPVPSIVGGSQIYLLHSPSLYPVYRVPKSSSISLHVFLPFVVFFSLLVVPYPSNQYLLYCSYHFILFVTVHLLGRMAIYLAFKAFSYSNKQSD